MNNDMRKFPRPLINFKIELMNNCIKKRTIDDSSPEGSFETPAKKSFSPDALSPDLGCFMDFCSPAASSDSLSPAAVPQSALFDRTHSKSETKEPASSTVSSQHAECGSTAKPGSDEGTLRGAQKCEKIHFDLDVDDIQCPSPFGTYTAVHAESGKNPSGNACQNKPLLCPSVAHSPQLSHGDGEDFKDVPLILKDEEDKGYFSGSCLKNRKLANPQFLASTSSPTLRLGEVKVAEDEGHSGSSSDSGCSTRAALLGPPFSLHEGDQCPAVCGLPLESENAPVEPLEGEVEEAWNIGLPMFESSVCHEAPVRLNAGNELSRQESEEVQGASVETLPESQTTLGGTEDTLDTSYETTLPLQVKVKSVVVAFGQMISSKKPTASPPDENINPAGGFQSGISRRQRPVVFGSEAEWEHQKNLYVSCVTKHMNENTGGAQDVMTELLKLMTDMADRTPGSTVKPFQHPSDLTCRNYQRRRNSGPKMSLSEWQAKNSPTHRRFARIPKIFERSPFP